MGVGWLLILVVYFRMSPIGVVGGSGRFSRLYFRISFGLCGRFTGAELMAFVISLTIVCIWVMTGHWLLMDGKYSVHLPSNL